MQVFLFSIYTYEQDPKIAPHLLHDYLPHANAFNHYYKHLLNMRVYVTGFAKTLHTLLKVERRFPFHFPHIYVEV